MRIIANHRSDDGNHPVITLCKINLETITRINIAAGNVNIAHTGGCVIIYRYFDTYLL